MCQSSLGPDCFRVHAPFIAISCRPGKHQGKEELWSLHQVPARGKPSATSCLCSHISWRNRGEHGESPPLEGLGSSGGAAPDRDEFSRDNTRLLKGLRQSAHCSSIPLTPLSRIS